MFNFLKDWFFGIKMKFGGGKKPTVVIYVGEMKEEEKDEKDDIHIDV